VNVIDRVEVDGLLNRKKPINIKFDRNYNFIIGQNGTGKTTLINLIAAILLCDAEKLEKIQFLKVVIFLRNSHSSEEPVISVTRSKKADEPFANFSYLIKDHQEHKGVTFKLDDFLGSAYSNAITLRHMRSRVYHDYIATVRKKIESLLQVRWLSIHRTNNFVERDEENRNQSPVDRKLDELRRNMAIYFGRMSKAYSDQILDFQQTSLLSMIRSESGFTLEKFSKEIDVEREKETLGSVFAALQVSKIKYQSMLEKHARDFKKAAEKLDQHSGVSIDELATIYNGWKAHVLVQEYGELEKKKLEIFSPRDVFLKAVNDLLKPRKTLSISARNDLVVKSSVGSNDVEFQDLSSGEKQLLIILGEALLQESESVIYIADEPELSLHISWQEKLTDSIRSVNANAQIVFATHSPDIVGSHGDKVIDMEFL